jgi:hypothetical protein
MTHARTHTLARPRTYVCALSLKKKKRVLKKKKARSRTYVCALILSLKKTKADDAEVKRAR